MKNFEVKLASAQRVPAEAFPRQTENFYHQSVSYNHLFKVENDLYDNLFVVTISDQFFHPETNIEFLNTVETVFQFNSEEPVLHDYLDPEKRHRHAVYLIAQLTAEAMKVVRNDTMQQLPATPFGQINLPEVDDRRVFEQVASGLPHSDKVKLPIFIGKDQWLSDYVSQLYYIISTDLPDKEFKWNGESVVINENEGRAAFEQVYRPLFEKILTFIQSSPDEYLELDQEESETFRVCSHAAYFVEDFRQRSGVVAKEEFMASYRKIFSVAS